MVERSRKAQVPTCWLPLAALLLPGTSCWTIMPATGPELRSEIVEHLRVLEDGWEDWLALLKATEVLEGVFHVCDPMAIQSKPEEFLEARVEAPRVLVGFPSSEARTFKVFNATIKRWAYRPMYASDLQHANGQNCIVFLHWGGKFIADSDVGHVLPITPVADLAARSHQLESFIHLLTLDPMAVARLVAKPDPRVESVLRRARGAAGNSDGVQACYDELRALGDDVIPGILDAMVGLLVSPCDNTKLNAAVTMLPIGASVGVQDAFALLHFVAGGSIRSLGWPPDSDAVARSGQVRMIALHLLAREVVGR